MRAFSTFLAPPSYGPGKHSHTHTQLLGDHNKFNALKRGVEVLTIYYLQQVRKQQYIVYILG